MSIRDKIHALADEGHEILFLEGSEFDDAIIGIAERADGMLVVAYDRMRCIEVLMAQEMDRDEAEEFFCFNTLGAWVGDGTPVFVDTRYAE